MPYKVAYAYLVNNYPKFGVLHETFLRRHVSFELTWNEVTDIACAAYSLVPNEHSKENAFFFKFDPYVYTPLVQLLTPKLKYTGHDKSLFALNGLLDIYALAIHNIKSSRERDKQTIF